jgi:hypothetical protein
MTEERILENSSNSFENRRIAMLIDGENAQPALINKMVAETGKYGLVSIRRIYGDWTTNNMSSWKKTLVPQAIQPIQQFRNTVGKNSTDSALIIDAMDILYEETVQGFCLVSSDADYTRLATRIRESGLFVMGIGQKKTPEAFVKACEVFVYTENLVTPEKTVAITPVLPREVSSSATADPLPLLRNAFDMAVQEDGWAFLGTLGTHLRRLDPSFDSRAYGYRQLLQLIRANTNTFEIKEKRSKEGPAAIYIRLKEERSS